MPKFTVLLPTHDHADMLFWSVASVQAQTRQDFELFIVGDGVPERTREVVAALQKQDCRIRFFDNPKGLNRGEEHRNQALKKSRGELICYHSDDDLWLPDHLETLEEALADNDLAHTMQIEIHPGKTPPTTWFFNAKLPTQVEALRRNQTGFGNASAGHTAKAYRSLPFGWRTAPPEHNTDLYMWLQFLDQRWCRVASVPRPTLVRFPALERKSWSIAQRCAEMALWTARLASPTERLALIRSVFEPLCTRTYAESVNADQRVNQLAGIVETIKPTLPARPALSLPTESSTPKYSPGTSLSFQAGSPDAAFLGYGFAEPESWGVWTSAASAAILLPLKDALENDAELLLDHKVLLVPECHEQMRVVLSVNGTVVDDWDATLACPAGLRKVPISADCLKNARQLAIQFRLEHPARPIDLGLSADSRLLGLGLIGLKLEHAA